MPVYSKAGIRRLALWESNDAKSEIISLSNRASGTFVIDEKKDVTDYRQRVKPHMVNFKVEAKDYSMGRPALYYLLRRLVDGRVSAEVVTRAITLSPLVYDGVFKFVGATNALGLDIEYILDAKERAAVLTLEKSFDWLDAKAIIDAAQNNTVETLTSFPVDHYDATMYRAPKFEFVKYGASETVLFERDEIISRKLSIKSNSQKNIYDASTCNYLDVTLELELSKAGKGDIKSFFEITDCPKLIVRETDPAGYEEHIFNAGVLSLTRNANIGDESRTMKLTFQGSIPPNMVTYANPGGATNHQYTYQL